MFTRFGRGILTPIGLANNTVEVSTVDKLKAAIGLAVSRNTNATGNAAAGLDILITQPLQLRAPIIIPKQAAGLTVRATGVVPISAKGEISSVFVVNAADVRLFGLSVIGSTGNGFAGFVSVDLTGLGGLGGRFTAEGNDFSGSLSVAGSFIGCVDDTVSGVRISGNRAVAMVPGGKFVQLAGTQWCVVNNLNVFGAIEDSTAAAGLNVISGNSMNGNDITITGIGGNAITSNAQPGTIDTSTSTGGNTISANTLVGAIVAGGSDKTNGNNT